MQTGLPFLQDVRTQSEDETRALGLAWANAFTPPVFVALTGDLGAGKTALIRGMCEAWECENQVHSPTFTRINRYDGRIAVLHADLYRLQNPEEVFALGLDEAFEEVDVALVEWAERAIDLLPFPRMEILCRHGDGDGERIFRLQECRIPEESFLRHGTRL